MPYLRTKLSPKKSTNNENTTLTQDNTVRKSTNTNTTELLAPSVLPAPLNYGAEKTQSTDGVNDAAGDKDIARSKYMMKSIAGLLSTASMYAGMEDVQNVKELAQDMILLRDEPIEDDDNNEHEYEDFPQKNEDALFDMSVEGVGAKSGITHDIIVQNLTKIFGLPKNEIFLKELPAWTLKDVLIQGHIILTTASLLFFAYLPKKSGDILKSGNLNIRSSLRGSIRYWAVLRDHLFYLYNSPTDVYFPALTIDLRTVTNIEIQKSFRLHENTKYFKIVTTERTLKFMADSINSASDWTKMLKKQQFATQHSDNNSIALNIPLTNILEVEKDDSLETAIILKVRAMESKETFAFDDYMFMFLDNSGVELKSALEAQLFKLKEAGTNMLYQMPAIVAKEGDAKAKTSNSKALIALDKWVNPQSLLNYEFSRISLHSPISTPIYIPSPSALIPITPRIVTSTLNVAPSVTSYIPLPKRLPTRDPKHDQGKVTHAIKSHIKSKRRHWLHKRSPSVLHDKNQEKITLESHSTLQAPIIKYEYDQTNEASEIENKVQEESRISDATPTKRDRRITDWTVTPLKNMANMWQSTPLHYRNKYIHFSDDDQYLVKDKDTTVSNEHFRNHFNLPKRETLTSSYFAHLVRNVPLYGKIYLGNNFICFRSLLPGSNTRMILPLHDVETCYKENGFRFGYCGLVIVIKGHEELFFEFASTLSRNDCELIILKRIEIFRSIQKQKDHEIQEDGTTNSVEFKKYSHPGKLKVIEDRIEAIGLDVPILVDHNSHILTKITPKKKYNIGLLTIGSRGDVQPYIALGKGLIKENHNVTIITHIEFKDFVESHGLNFVKLAGNPSELMALMVEHESMNVALLRDASKNFKSWIKDLLESSWESCKALNLNLLIESPSAMVGIHIAEALNIPYFRAFTMPWTRTRAYPHAFIVPDQKRGGNYNYLTHVLFENIFWKGISGQVNKWRVETLGLKKTNLYYLQQNKIPFLYNISPTVFPPSVDFSEWITVTGYWFLDDKNDYEPPNDLVAFISKARTLQKKLVYIGFGSIVVSNAKEMTIALIKAVEKADVYCILNKGWSDRLGDESAKNLEVNLPSCVFNAGNVPHDWLFPQVDAAVHHGGSGTTGASLRSGLPTIIKPFFGDQFFYATRIEDMGVGIALKKFNTENLASALKEITTNKKMSDKAKDVQMRISKEDGVGTAITTIYSELDYAKGLTEARRRRSRAHSSSISTVKNALSNIVPLDLPNLALEDSWIML
ncbi:sterol 3-beta-glucosyltransferase NDAI_0A00550 [Naumovozyma dairenensis CBS 421]|uniref:Sterol 3-beta-glucosyltransferase n=1 Tax=Naumovozyma dairenensis (strain ATCC 10597 / BCRC 20456 / CBS 421 / NBRC 0211 / NRRL Y-12639) TaxID=1071378 RepID=G0W325_NAUDC|nr:hypothetical protein NDAI_0A00550 [Naumovozyma dairenensis CBS 421]CCD22213.1 hypothetical protein NDAI_0A00550 [Naumovozyma dairenensis CBS 421]